MTNPTQQNMPIDTFIAQAGKQARQEADLFRNHLKKLPEKRWMNQSFCTDWTIKDVVEHQARQGQRMLDVARQAIKGKDTTAWQPELNDTYIKQIEDLNRIELADRMADTAYELYDLLEHASPEDLYKVVDLPFAQMPLAFLGSMRLSELSLHSWDVRVVDDLTAKVSKESLPLLVPGLTQMLPALVHQDTAHELQTVSYQFELTGATKEHIGLKIENGQTQIERGFLDTPDVVLHLDTESFLRMAWGRLKNLDWMVKNGWIKVEGDNEAALKLKQLFQGM